MQIRDYESGKHLSDVNITLTREEAEDMVSYLHVLLENPHVPYISISEIRNLRLEKEISFSVAS
jgi:type VI protein secretion system component Hcp